MYMKRRNSQLENIVDELGGTYTLYVPGITGVGGKTRLIENAILWTKNGVGTFRFHDLIPTLSEYRPEKIRTSRKGKIMRRK